MSAEACGFADGVMHDHGAPQCHAASRRAGAVEALREMATALVDRSDGCTCETCQTSVADAQVLRDRADLIERGA